MRAMQEQHKIAEFFTADKEKSHKQSGGNDCGERLAGKKHHRPNERASDHENAGGKSLRD